MTLAGMREAKAWVDDASCCCPKLRLPNLGRSKKTTPSQLMQGSKGGLQSPARNLVTVRVRLDPFDKTEPRAGWP